LTDTRSVERTGQKGSKGNHISRKGETIPLYTSFPKPQENKVEALWVTSCHCKCSQETNPALMLIQIKNILLRNFYKCL